MSKQLEIDAVLANLKEFIRRNAHRAFFAPPAEDYELVYTCEMLRGLMPASYRKFLKAYNGGFIAAQAEVIDDDFDFASEWWNSNVIFGTGRLMSAYHDIHERFVKDIGYAEPWVYVPFCQTLDQETLYFGPATDGKEMAVYDGFSESPPEEWTVIYPDFTALLDDYVLKAGMIRTIGEF
jgi:hypothetical protein